MNNKSLASYIDHTLLKPTATDKDIRKLCHEAIENKFAAGCVNPFNVPICWEELRKTGIKVCTVIGFPLGINSISDKVNEANNACRMGANELDFVINIGMVKEHAWDYIKRELFAMYEFQSQGYTVKVILETCLLTNEEIIEVCKLAAKLGINFVKTSTGFSTGGATVETVKLMYDTINKWGKNTQVKASGGIKDRKTALAMINAGATRIGTSAGIAITKE